MVKTHVHSQMTVQNGIDLSWGCQQGYVISEVVKVFIYDVWANIVMSSFLPPHEL